MIKQFWNQLPIWGKAIIVVIFAYIIWKIYQYFVRKVEAGNYNASVSQSQTALNQLANQGVLPSYAQAEYTSMANALEKAFSGCGTGFTTVVKPTFERMKNDADVYALIKNYGVRDIPECAWGTFSGDLGATLAYKLTGFTFCPPNDLLCNGSLAELNDILKKNQITFSF